VHLLRRCTFFICNMRLDEFIHELEFRYPPDWAMRDDRVGLFCGDLKRGIEKIIIALDITDSTLGEAIEGGFDLLLTHHPPLRSDFSAVIAGQGPVGRIYRAIQHDVAIYSAHTNLDFAADGVTTALAGILEIAVEKPLYTKTSEKLFKLVVFVPKDSFKNFRRSLLNKVPGFIGNYSHCSFAVPGEGTFMPLDGANPFIGQVGKLETVKELRFETIVPNHLLDAALEAVRTCHPYEEPAFDIYPLENDKIRGGFGAVGKLHKMMRVTDIAEMCAEKLPTEAVRFTGDSEKFAHNTAVLAGSGDSFVNEVINSGVDVFIVGELKHSSALELLDAGIASVVAGHFPTEWVVLPRLKEVAEQILQKFEQHGEIKISDREETVFHSFKATDNYEKK